VYCGPFWKLGGFLSHMNMPASNSSSCRNVSFSFWVLHISILIFNFRVVVFSVFILWIWRRIILFSVIYQYCYKTQWVCIYFNQSQSQLSLAVVKLKNRDLPHIYYIFTYYAGTTIYSYFKKGFLMFRAYCTLRIALCILHCVFDDWNASYM